jgi:hypothetical protein
MRPPVRVHKFSYSVSHGYSTGHGALAPRDVLTPHFLLLPVRKVVARGMRAMRNEYWHKNDLFQDAELPSDDWVA